MNIYDLTGRAQELDAQYEEIMSAIEMNDGEITPETEEALAAYEEEKQSVMDEIAQKPEQYLRWYANEKADLEKLKKAAEGIAAKKKSKEKKVDFIKGLVADAMNLSGKGKIAGDTMKAWFTSRQGVAVDEEAAVAPYQKEIDGLREDLPAYIAIEVKIMKSNVDKDAEVLPAGFTKIDTQSLTIR